MSFSTLAVVAVSGALSSASSAAVHHNVGGVQSIMICCKVLLQCYRFRGFQFLNDPTLKRVDIDSTLYFNDHEDRCSLLEDGQCSAVDRMIDALGLFLCLW